MILFDVWGALKGLDPAVAVVMAAVSLIASVVLYATLVAQPCRSGGGVRAFLRFERLAVGPILRFAYVLGAAAALVFGVAAGVLAGIEAFADGGAPAAALAGAKALAVLAVAQVALRVALELPMMAVNLCDDVRALREAISDRSSAPVQAPEPVHAPAAAAPSPALASGGCAPQSAGLRVTKVDQGQDEDLESKAVGVPVARQPGAARPARTAQTAETRWAPEPEPESQRRRSAQGAGRRWQAADAEPAEGPVGVAPTPSGFAPVEAEVDEVAGPQGPGVEAWAGYSREVPIDDVAAWDALVVDETTVLGEEPEPESPPRAARILWDCPCGSRGNEGAYCGHCGLPREAALRVYDAADGTE